jgi:membrane protein YdbS with pleckstrin-like domain
MQPGVPQSNQVNRAVPHPRIIPKRPPPPQVVVSSQRFPGQQENEHVFAIRRPSKLYAIGPCMPAAIGLAGILVWHKATSNAGTIAFVVSIALVLISIPFIFRFLTSWMGRVYIVTDRRVVIKDGIMSQDLEQVELTRIEQVKVEKPNLFAMLCGLGTVGVKPGGQELKLRGISRPRDLADLILALRYEAVVRSYDLPERPVIRNQRLRQALDSADPQPPDPLFPPPRRPPMNGLLHRRLPIWLSPPESFVEVVYRHWIVLVARELVALGLLILTVLVCLGLHSLTHVSGMTIMLVALGGALLTLAYTVLTYIDWADDVFILTTHRVIDIDRVFLILAEYSSEIPLAQVQDVLVDQGFFGQLFGYGTIQVEVAGGKEPMQMRHITDPKALMSRIFAQVQAKARRDNNFEREKRRAEVHQIMGHVLDSMLIQVPDLSGLTIVGAAASIRNAGLRLLVSGERAVPGLPSGMVLEQAPLPGSMALAEGRVQVVLSGQSSGTPPPRPAQP